MKLLPTILMICSIVTVAPSQRRVHRRPHNDVRISKRHPTIYLSFVRFGKSKPDEGEGYSGQRVLLRLHNNTRWSISLQAGGVADDSDEDARMFYDIEEVPEPEFSSVPSSSVLPFPVPPDFEKQHPKREVAESPKPDKFEHCEAGIGERFHVGSIIKLLPGKSLLFSVPHEHLCKNLRIVISYSYSWENDTAFYGEYAPQHGVVFFGSKLPKEIR